MSDISQLEDDLRTWAKVSNNGSMMIKAADRIAELERQLAERKTVTDEHEFLRQLHGCDEIEVEGTDGGPWIRAADALECYRAALEAGNE